MEGRIRILFLRLCAAMLALSGAASTAFAAPVVQPEVVRRTMEIPRIDTEDIEVGVFSGLLGIEDFGSHPLTGVRLAYHITERFFMEGSYGQARAGKTSYEVLSGSARLLTDEEREYRYYDLSAGYNLMLGESFIAKRAFNSALYVVAGIGGTRFAGNDQFSVSLGAGYRFLATDWLALHLDMRDHLFDTELLGDPKTTHNLAAHAGITCFF